MQYCEHERNLTLKAGSRRFVCKFRKQKGERRAFHKLRPYMIQ
jgi:hypothetical protein